MIYSFFLFPSLCHPAPFPSPLSLLSVTGSHPLLFADSALCPPSGSSVIVLRVDIGHWRKGDLQQNSEEDGGRRPSVSQRTAAGHPFILLFACRQCSSRWRRNSIFILSLTVLFFLLPHYPTFSLNLFSSPILPSPALPFLSLFFSSLSLALSQTHTHSLSFSF